MDTNNEHALISWLLDNQEDCALDTLEYNEYNEYNEYKELDFN
jgi:hypothetical protein